MERAKRIRVVLADDEPDIHEIVSATLKKAADMELIGECINGVDALVLCKKLHPDVLLLDVMMPLKDGVETARELRQAKSTIKILVLSSFQDRDTVQAMLQHNVDGYIDKGALFRNLTSTIRTIYHGEKVFSSGVLANMSAPAKGFTQIDFDLSDREMHVLTLMANGLSKQAIADNLGITKATVKYHVKNICVKLGVHTHTQAVIVAMKNHLV